MRRPSTVLVACLAAACGRPSLEARFEVQVLARSLEVPWEIRTLPGGDLLVTERRGRLLRIDAAGTVTELAELPEVVAQGESGLMGMALHPRWPEVPYLYLCFTYAAPLVMNRVDRFEFDGLSLGPSTPILEGMRGANIHDGCRLGFGPDGLLYVTMGDAADESLAQDPASLNGKVLRVRDDGSLPEGQDSPVFTLGHRNPQGLDFHPETGAPFVTEHGPATDDEINRLREGGNYGWPLVGGAPGDPRFVDAVYAWTPTIAPAGGAFYTSDAVPRLEGAFLLVTLKEKDLRVLLPAAEGFTAVREEQILFDGAFGRLRAIRPLPDGRILLSTSNRDGRGTPEPDDDRILLLTPR